MTKYKVTNGNINTEFSTEEAANNYAATNGGTVSSFEETIITPTTAEQVAIYLDTKVFPFVKNLINTFAAENISMGITQYNKAGDVLSLFTKQYPTASLGGSISLKACLDTGSLYEAIKVIQHIRDNPTEYSGMSPFVTDARLLQMKNDLERFLGVTLTT